MARKKRRLSKGMRTKGGYSPSPKSNGIGKMAKDIVSKEAHDYLMKAVSEENYSMLSRAYKYSKKARPIIAELLKAAKPQNLASAANYGMLAIALGSEFLPRGLGGKDSDAAVSEARAGRDVDMFAARS